MNYLFFDNKFYFPDDLNLSEVVLENQFQLHQRIFYLRNELPFFYRNLGLLEQKSRIFGLDWPDFMKDHHELLRLARRLLNKNRLYRTGLLDFRLIWGKKGPHCLIQSHPSEEKVYSLARKGLLMNVLETAKFITAEFGALDVFCQPFWDFARSELKGLTAGNSLIVNADNCICEAIGANVFFIREKSLITPSESTGCYIDPVRQKILEAAHLIGCKVIESDRIPAEQVNSMEEVFIASEADGMQWVIGIGSKRFIHTKTDELNLKLNELLSASVQ